MVSSGIPGTEATGDQTRTRAAVSSEAGSRGRVSSNFRVAQARHGSGLWASVCLPALLEREPGALQALCALRGEHGEFSAGERGAPPDCPGAEPRPRFRTSSPGPTLTDRVSRRALSAGLLVVPFACSCGAFCDRHGGCWRRLVLVPRAGGPAGRARSRSSEAGFGQKLPREEVARRYELACHSAERNPTVIVTAIWPMSARSRRPSRIRGSSFL